MTSGPSKRRAVPFDDGGREQTCESLARALTPHVQMLAEVGKDVYSSDEFKQDVDDELLVDRHKLALSLVRLDNRGGIFAQAAL